MRTTLAAVAVLLAAMPAGAATLSFEDIWARVAKAHDVSPAALEAVALLETPPSGLPFPLVRIEAGATSAHNVDVMARNLFRYDAFTTLLSVDYPLLDGGLRSQQTKLASIDAQSFRQRVREESEQLFRETLDAVARLYSAQERLRILGAGLRRAVDMRQRARQMLELREISNVTAAQWQDESIVAESLLLDLELQRLESETHLRQLMGEAGDEPIEVAIDVDQRCPGVDAEAWEGALALASDPAPLVARDEGVARSTIALERRRLELAEAQAARKPQLTMSAFGGITALGNIPGPDSNGGYGLFGLRFTVALPMFDRAASRRVAEARMHVEQARLEQRRTTDQIRRQTSSLWLAIASLEKRIDLLAQMVDLARGREQSVIRLVAAGIRAENDVASAAADRARRESDLLGARVDLWKYQRLLERRTGTSDSRVAEQTTTPGGGS